MKIEIAKEVEALKIRKVENTKIKTFEDLRVYQMAREFSRKVQKLISKLPAEEKYALAPQMRKAKLSITKT